MRLIACAFLLLAFSLSLTAQDVAKDECELPAVLSTEIARQWPGWKILHINNLTPEDQNLWTYARGRVCPGVATGHFLDSSGYAVAVVRGKLEAVLAAAQDGQKWVISVVMPPTNVRRFSVVWTAKPGTYQDRMNGRRVQAVSDGIAMEAISSEVTVFVRQKNRWIPVRTSQ